MFGPWPVPILSMRLVAASPSSGLHAVPRPRLSLPLGPVGALDLFERVAGMLQSFNPDDLFPVPVVPLTDTMSSISSLAVINTEMQDECVPDLVPSNESHKC